MQHYRLYMMNSTGHISRAADIEAIDDEAAVAKALQIDEGAAKELWLRDRLVRQFEAARREA